MGTIVVFFCVRDDVKLLPQQRHSNKFQIDGNNCCFLLCERWCQIVATTEAFEQGVCRKHAYDLEACTFDSLIEGLHWLLHRSEELDWTTSLLTSKDRPRLESDSLGKSWRSTRWSWWWCNCNMRENSMTMMMSRAKCVLVVRGEWPDVGRAHIARPSAGSRTTWGRQSVDEDFDKNKDFRGWL